MQGGRLWSVMRRDGDASGRDNGIVVCFIVSADRVVRAFFVRATGIVACLFYNERGPCGLRFFCGRIGGTDFRKITDGGDGGR